MPYISPSYYYYRTPPLRASSAALDQSSLAGTHLDAAAAHFSRANKEIASLKAAMAAAGAPPPAYPTPDPLERTTASDYGRLGLSDGSIRYFIPRALIHTVQ